MNRTLAFVAPIVLAWLYTLPACAQDGAGDAGGEVDDGPPRALAPAHNMEALEKAQALFAKMIKAYQAAPTMTDRATFEAWAADQKMSEIETDIRMGEGSDVWMKTTRTLLVGLGDKMYLEYSDLEDRYLTRTMVDDVMTTLVGTFGQYGGAMAPTAFRYGKGFEEIMNVLIKGLPEQARVSGYRTIDDLDGRKLEQVTIVSAVGSAEINVDAETKFLVRTRCEWQSPNAPVPNFKQVVQMTYNPKVHDTLPIPITWERGGRTEFSSWRAMRGLAEDHERQAD